MHFALFIVLDATRMLIYFYCLYFDIVHVITENISLDFFGWKIVGSVYDVYDVLLMYQYV